MGGRAWIVYLNYIIDLRVGSNFPFSSFKIDKCYWSNYRIKLIHTESRCHTGLALFKLLLLC